MPVEKLENGSGRILRGCLWVGDGAGTAPLPGMKANFRRRTFWKHSAIWATPHCRWAAARARLGCGAIRRIRSAVRSQASADADVAAHVLRLRYVCERDHRPVEHGDLEFDLSQATWVRRHDDARVQKMAECFLESYLKKKFETAT